MDVPIYFWILLYLSQARCDINYMAGRLSCLIWFSQIDPPALQAPVSALDFDIISDVKHIHFSCLDQQLKGFMHLAPLQIFSEVWQSKSVGSLNDTCMRCSRLKRRAVRDIAIQQVKMCHTQERSMLSWNQH